VTAAGERRGDGRVLGVDVGSVRVGLASSDETRTVATPLMSLPRSSKDLWKRLNSEIEQRDIALAVVGLPRLLNGTEGDAAADARHFAADFENRASVPVEFWDERFTTALAERYLVSAGLRRERRRRAIDSVAAAVLLQSWLDAQRRQP
jgi:putative Holliday junction resolvase